MGKNTQLDYEQLANSIRAGDYVPVYLLQGEEIYFIDALSDLIENSVLKPEEKGFNQAVMYGKDVSVRDIVMAAKRFPMMSKYQVIIVKEAQQLDARQLDDFIPYLEKPLASTLLVICYKGKKVDQRTKLGKLFQKHKSVTFDKLYENQIVPWTKSFLRSKGKSIEEEAAQLLLENLGRDLVKIAKELNQLIEKLPEQVQLINRKHIEDNIDISKEFNVFELQKALGEKNIKKALQIVAYFGSDTNKNPMIVMLASLHNWFTKLMLYHQYANLNKGQLSAKMGVSEYFMDDYTKAAANYSPEKIAYCVQLINEYDLKGKGLGLGSGIGEAEMMKEIILKLFSDQARLPF